MPESGDDVQDDAGIGLTDPPVDGDESHITEYSDGIAFRDSYWLAGFNYAKDEETLEFSYAECEIPADELKQSHREAAEEIGRLRDGKFDASVDRLSQVPDELLEVVDNAGYEIVGWGNGTTEATDPDPDPDDWLYDGECPDCGPALCVEVIGADDVCYECGAEVAA